MWTTTFDGKNIFDAAYFHVSRNIGGKAGEKYAIQGFSAAGLESAFICGFYPDEERAMAELQKILKAVEEGVKVYKF